MKKLLTVGLVVLFVFSVMGCKQEDGNKELQTTIASSVGYLIAKNKPELSNDMIKWYDSFIMVSDSDFQPGYQDGIAKLIAMVTDDPFLSFQIQNAMGLLGISALGPKVPDEVEQYRYIVDAFMIGVAAVPKQNMITF